MCIHFYREKEEDKEMADFLKSKLPRNLKKTGIQSWKLKCCLFWKYRLIKWKMGVLRLCFRPDWRMYVFMFPKNRFCSSGCSVFQWEKCFVQMTSSALASWGNLHSAVTWVSLLPDEQNQFLRNFLSWLIKHASGYALMIFAINALIIRTYLYSIQWLILLCMYVCTQM